MRTFLIGSVVVLGACASQSGATKKAAPRLAAIMELEDRRALGELPQLAAHGEAPAVRRRAFLALGRLQLPSTAGVIVDGLADADSQVRSEAAFAAGLLGQSWVPLPEDAKTRLTNGILAREEVETDAATRLALLEAMGRVATPALVERLVERLGASPDERARAALALGVAQRAKAVLPARAFPVLAALLAKWQPDGVRFGAGYALVSSKNPAARDALLTALSDAAPELRAQAAKGLGEVGTDADVAVLRETLEDADYRVAVEATRALAKLSLRCTSVACPALSALGELNLRVQKLIRSDAAGGGQPLLALTQAELPPFARALLLTLRAQLAGGHAPNEQTAGDLANLDCRFAYALDRLTGTRTETATCGGARGNDARRAQLGLQALLDTRVKLDATTLAPQVAPLAQHADARVKMAAVELLGTLNAPASLDTLRALLRSDELIVAVAAASALAHLDDTTQSAAIRELAAKVQSLADVAPPVAEALAILDAKEAVPDLKGWLRSPHFAVRTAAADAITKLEGAPLFAQNVEFPESTSARPPLVAQGTKLAVSTAKGSFEISLYTDDAPLTSANLVALAKRAYFRDLTFHRVVPDFVVQGGDPRGDGNGGPGYTIRCEINHRPYARNVVGMALSGRDTGGSQFFVTTAAQPHLEGRYTAFGEVTSGQEVVDQLLEGDALTDVRVIEPSR